MTFINSYKAPEANAADGSFDDPYDLKSHIPIPLLETPRVQLVPFTPAIHAESFFTAFAKDGPALSKYLPLEWPTLTVFLADVEKFFRKDPAMMLFVIIDKTRPPTDPRIPAGRVAGLIGWLHASAGNLSLEIGPVIVLTEFQRTFVSANAIGLLLKYVLDVPADGGLGFRRVAWSANPLNEGSIAAAEKMGFVKEGVMRWAWVLPEGKEGHPAGEGRGPRNGRDTVLLSLCWDTWVSGARDAVVKRMERV